MLTATCSVVSNTSKSFCWWHEDLYKSHQQYWCKEVANCIELITKWAQAWQLQVSVDKCYVLNLGKLVCDISLNINNNALPVVPTCEGRYFTPTLQWMLLVIWLLLYILITLLPERDYVTFGLCCRNSVYLSVVCNVGAPYSGGWTFRQNFFTAIYAGHPLTSVQNFTEIVLGEPLRRER